MISPFLSFCFPLSALNLCPYVGNGLPFILLGVDLCNRRR